MKKVFLFLIALFLICSWLHAQQVFVAPRLQYVQGKGIQEGKFEAAGIGAQLQAFKSPGSKLGLIVSYDWMIAGTETKRISLAYGGNTDVDYTSTMNKFMSGITYAPMNGSFVTPYITLQGGLIWYNTKFYVNDPFDPDYCRPEQNRNAKISFAAGGNVESGIKVRLRKQSGRQMYLQAGANYTLGSRAKYIKLGDEPDGENTTPYTSKFRTSTGSTHSHTIGTLYKTNTSQLAFNLGLNFEIN